MRIWAFVGLLAVGGLAIMPAFTAIVGHDAACARGCDGDCEPGCLGCACGARAVVGEAREPARQLVRFVVEAAPVPLSLGRADRPPPRLLRPPRA